MDPRRTTGTGQLTVRHTPPLFSASGGFLDQAKAQPDPGHSDRGGAAARANSEPTKGQPRLPKYIRECGQRSLLVTDPANPAAIQVVPCRCGSWKCEGCAPWANSRLRARLQAAIDLYGGPEAFLFATFTVNQRGKPRMRRWRDANHAVRGLSECSRELCRSLSKRPEFVARADHDKWRECPYCSRQFYRDNQVRGSWAPGRAPTLEVYLRDQHSCGSAQARKLARVALPPLRVHRVFVLEQAGLTCTDSSTRPRWRLCCEACRRMKRSSTSAAS